MSEYQQDHSDQRLIGSPPGYVGFSQGGQLTNWVQERPHSVVLIDEVEKAHERILDIFLQILEGARLTDGKGATVDFSETILIFTSNIGAASADGLDAEDSEAVAEYFEKEVELFFDEDLERPELFNRLKKGGVVAFNFIEEEVARMGIMRQLQGLSTGISLRLESSRCSAGFVFDRESSEVATIVEEILNRCEYAKYGLRSVNNKITQLAGLAVGTFLDAALDQNIGQSDFHFRWDETESKVKITAD